MARCPGHAAQGSQPETVPPLYWAVHASIALFEAFAMFYVNVHFVTIH